MNKAIHVSRLVVCIRRCLLTAAPLALAACDFSTSSRNEIFIEAVPFNSARFDQSVDIEPSSGAIHLTFDDSATFVSRSVSLLYRGNYLTHVRDQGYFRPGSILVSDRNTSWHGPLVVLPPLESGRAYNASTWIRLVETDRPANAKLMWTQVSGGVTTNVALAEKQIEPRVWVKLEGEFIGNPQGYSDINVLSVDIDETDIKYLMDDFIVAYAELSEEMQAAALAARSNVQNLIINGSVENGLEPWTHQGGIITRSSVHAHTGTHSVLIAGRQQEWNAPVMPVIGMENDKVYLFSIFARLSDGEPTVNMKLTLRRVTAGQTTFTSIGSGQATSTGWTEISGTFTAVNIRESSEVAVYLEAEHPTVSYFVDTLTLEPLP